MNDNFYKHIIETLPVGYAYHKIVLDEYGIPCDYEFIEVNATFETITGLKSTQIIGRKITEVIPNIRSIEFDLIDVYGSVAIDRKEREFEQCLEPLKRWYKINVFSPEKYFFVTIFTEITKEKNQIASAKDITAQLHESIALERMATISEEFLHSYNTQLDYKKITDDFLKISGAKYATFMLYDKEEKVFTPKSVAGCSKNIKNTWNILGYNPDDRKWPLNPIHEEGTRHCRVITYPSFKDLVGNAMSKDEALIIENALDIGESLLIRIHKNDDLLGFFAFFMPRGIKFKREKVAEIFTRQLGMLIVGNRADKKLRESVLSMREAQNIAKLGNWEYNHFTNSFNCSDEFYKILQICKDEINVDKAVFHEILHKEDKTMIELTWESSLKNKQSYDQEFRLIMKDGNIKWVHVTGEHIYDNKGDPLNTIGIIQDVTERKMAEEALLESESRWQFALEGAGDGVWDYNFQTGEVFYSKQWKQMLGYTDIEITNSRDEWDKRIHIDDREMCFTKLDNHFRGKSQIYENEYRVLCKDGTYKWVLARGKVVTWSEDGKPLRFIGIHNDLTNRREMESALRSSEEGYKYLVENTGDIIYTFNADNVFTYVSPTWKRFLGYDASEVVGQPFSNFVYEEDLQVCLDYKRDVLNGKLKTNTVEYRVKHKNGSIKWHSSSGSLIQKNGVLSYLGVARDITESKRMEEQIKIEKERLQTTILSIGDGVISTDENGNVLLLNKVAEQLTGWSSNEAIGIPISRVFRIINEESREICVKLNYKVLEKGVPIELENNIILLSEDGTERYIQYSASPIKRDDKKTKGIVLVFRDISEKRKKQKEIEFLSFHDQLTGLYNRRFFEEELKRIDIKNNLPLTFIMIDVNGLKLVNDAFGHAHGDEVLKTVSRIMSNECRATDIVTRTGGDEFVIILPKTDYQNAGQIAKRIKNATNNEKIGSINLSISCGWQTKQLSQEDILATLKKAEDNMYRNKLSESASLRYKTIDIIMKTLYEKNEREEKHSKRVSNICASIGAALDLSYECINELRTVGLMHDIGKIAIDDSILNKVDKFNELEWIEISRHPEIGYQILSSVNEFAPIAELVLTHHERWDGKGYPRGLKGEEIPLQARIIAVADAYDAMVSHRPYRKSLTEVEAVEELIRNAGTQFDPEIVKVFIEDVLVNMHNR